MSAVRVLVRHDAKEFFAEHCEEIFKAWLSVLSTATLPENITHADSRVADVIVSLNNIITTSETPYYPRLAYIQLIRVLATLKERIKSDRDSGLIIGKSGHRDATLAIDTCLAKGMVDRKVIHELRRVGNRWAILSKVSPLLVLTFTDTAERIMYVPSLSHLY